MKTRHHLRPRSRGGHIRNNIVVLPERYHQAWHYLFGNLTPDEAKEFIDIVMRPNAKWNARNIDELRIALMRRKG